MIPGKLVAALENELIAGAQDKDASLLPEIAVCAALAETFSHGLYASDQSGRAQRSPPAAFEPEGLVRPEVLVQIHLACEMELLDKMPRTAWASASNGDESNPGSLQFPLDAHEGSSLLPCEHSAEMAQEGKHDAPARPERLKFNLMALERPDSYTGDTGHQLFIGHFCLLMHTL